MRHRTLLDDRHVFRESEYLAIYPGIAEAIEKRNFPSGWAHYQEFGRVEGRAPCLFEETFYLRSYPLVGTELAEGRTGSAFDHYVLFGRGRGYLPHPKAERPSNPSGGLWIDSGDASDRIRGRYETGQITEHQAALLEAFVCNGYVVMPAVVPDSVLQAAATDLERGYRGEIPQLRFQCDALGHGSGPWRPEMLSEATKALDIHYCSKPIRQLIFTPAIAAFLALIFESKALASQTLGFLRGSADAIHQDTAYVPYTCPTSFAASWIALEDVSPGGGELFYHPGSHRLPDFRYDGKFKSQHEAMRANSNLEGNQAANHQRSLLDNANRFGLERKQFAAKRGDVLIWHADLVHGGSPVSERLTRKSIVTHYCPRHHAPLFCEQHQVALHEHEGHLFTSSHYAGMSPAD
ncbi:MAG TPA: phytanoyl-CoA dioxygenase family protein [Acetobacteraceae bacterium]|jgi:ectoine hydroxylase-related dioxygenase (phytanoyl-CoA dioxygenase family)|nr:phytanoyl-CoA dioxygenase family protein [Acetobacteraceae bacterium]